MRWWYVYGLSGPDYLHLSESGYAIKGDLAAKALLNTIDAVKRGGARDGLVLAPARDEDPRSVAAWLRSTQPFAARPDLLGGRPAASPAPAKKP